MKRLLFLLFFLPFITSAQTGFFDSSIWLLPEKPIGGEQVTLTVAFRNQENESLRGVIEFLDGNTILGQRDIVISPGAVNSATLGFTITPGMHSFSARAINMQYVGSGALYTGTFKKAQMQKISVKQESTASIEARVLTRFSEEGASPVTAAVDSVLSYIPEGAQDRIVRTFSGVDTWRENNASKVEAKQENTEGIARTGYGLLLFILAHQIAFYLLCIFIFFIILRFIFRLIFRRR